MTEAEWFTSSNPAAMIRLVSGTKSRCCGCIWCDNGDGTVSMANGQKCCRLCDNQSFASDRLVSDRKLRLWVGAMAACNPNGKHSPAYASWQSGSPYQPWGEEEPRMMHDEMWIWTHIGVDVPGDLPLHDRADLLREIIGNPFRPVRSLWGKCPGCGWDPQFAASGMCRTCAGKPDWLTSQVFTLAQAVYEARDWSGLGPLSDALEEAGCDNEDIIQHLRGWQPFARDSDGYSLPCGPHVRGCWALDLILWSGTS